LLSKKRSTTPVFLKLLRARKDLKKLPCFFFIILAVKNATINAIADK